MSAASSMPWDSTPDELCGLEVDDDNDVFADDLFGLVVLAHAGDDGPFLADIDLELQELVDFFGTASAARTFATRMSIFSKSS